MDGPSLAPSPLKHAAMLVVPPPIEAAETFDNVAVALQLVVQPLAGARFAVPKEVPVQALPG